jgi:hypothetical protein
MHVYVILAEEHKLIFSIFNQHQQFYEATVFQIPVLHKHVQHCTKFYETPFTPSRRLYHSFILQDKCR